MSRAASVRRLLVICLLSWAIIAIIIGAII
jgi:hypothetical protein